MLWFFYWFYSWRWPWRSLLVYFSKLHKTIDNENCVSIWKFWLSSWTSAIYKSFSYVLQLCVSLFSLWIISDFYDCSICLHFSSHFFLCIFPIFSYLFPFCVKYAYEVGWLLVMDSKTKQKGHSTVLWKKDRFSVKGHIPAFLFTFQESVNQIQTKMINLICELRRRWLD